MQIVEKNLKVYFHFCIIKKTFLNVPIVIVEHKKHFIKYTVYVKENGNRTRN